MLSPFAQTFLTAFAMLLSAQDIVGISHGDTPQDFGTFEEAPQESEEEEYIEEEAPPEEPTEARTFYRDGKRVEVRTGGTEQEEIGKPEENIFQEAKTEEEEEDSSEKAQEDEHAEEGAIEALEAVEAVEAGEAEDAHEAAPARESLAVMLLRRGKYLVGAVGLAAASVVFLLTWKRRRKIPVPVEIAKPAPAMPIAGPATAEESSPRLEKALEAIEQEQN